MRCLKFLWVLVGLLLLASCAQMPTPDYRASAPHELRYAAPLYRDHPLVGRFWSPVSEEFVGWEEVDRTLPAGGWLMLGEQHDHPDHHLLELFFLDYLGRTGRLGAVALEIPRDDLISAAAEQAVTAVPIDLGEPARTKVRSSEREIAHFSEAHTNYLSQLIVDSHCGMFGLDQAKPFVDVQIARDQHMAIRLLELTEPAAVNLFIGGRAMYETIMGFRFG